MTRYGAMIGALLGGLAVAFGAFGAHALRDSLDEYHLGVYEKAVNYHFGHALALLVAGWVASKCPRPRLAAIAAHFFFVGVIVFSGSLYLLALTGVRKWGMVTPIGGVCFLLGWLLLAMALRPSSHTASS